MRIIPLYPVRKAEYLLFVSLALVLWNVSSYRNTFRKSHLFSYKSFNGRVRNIDQALTVSGSEVTSAVDPSPKLPVTILSGFLGSGKTTLLQHLLTSTENNKTYAVIVNDMNELNIDSVLVKPFIQQQKEELIEMSNGCICCTLREDLLKEVLKLGKEAKYDHLIIESTGISEPMAVAETFVFPTNDTVDGVTKEVTLMDFAEIDSMVTVVDAVNFCNDMRNVEDLESRNLQANENDTRTITDLLIAQVEFASVILLNKCDMIDEEQKQEVKSYLRALNSDAKIIETIRSNVRVDEIVGSKSYDYDKVSQSAAWIQAMNNLASERANKVSEVEEYGISSILYKARRPFHPSRLMNFIENAFPIKSESENNENLVDVGTSKILRSKGFFWLANDPQRMYIWSQAGGLFSMSQGGSWWIDTPTETWPEDPEDLANIMLDFDESNDGQGDRRQELVLIGTSMENGKIISNLNKCLLTDEEMNEGMTVWKNYDNPFPDIEMEDD